MMSNRPSSRPSSRLNSRRRQQPQHGGAVQSENYSSLLLNTNNLLSAVGITAKKISSINELTRVASSMFVAVYEALFQRRLEGIVRENPSKSDYEFNVQSVIDGLSDEIKMDLQHITGKSIVQGDIRALTHLVHIFVRIVAITTQSESQSSLGQDGRNFNDGLQDDNDRDSLSTHESTFQDSNVNGVSRKLSSASRAFVLGGGLQSLSAERVRRLCEEDARQLMLSTEVQLQQEQRIEEARFRREKARQVREGKLGQANRRRIEISEKVQQARWIEDSMRASDSHKKRQSSEEQTMLRQIYRGLLSKLHAWRREERQEARERVGRMRDEAKDHIESLQVLFEDRVRLLQEESNKARKAEEDHARAHKRMGTDLLHSYSGRQKRLLETQRGLLAQRRQQQLLKRREAHKNLLALLNAESWSETLRNDTESNFIRSMRGSDTTSPGFLGKEGLLE